MGRSLPERTAVARCAQRSDGAWLIITLDGRSVVSDRELAQGAPINIPKDKQGRRR